MSEKKYFQWQNEFLVKSIYPHREEKLRDFLVFCEEIDLWKKHGKMSAKVLETKKKAYEKKQADILRKMVSEYDKQRKYFCEEDGTGEYKARYEKLIKEPGLGKDFEEVLEKVRKLHSAFQVYLDKVGNNPWKRKVFIAQRVTAWEQYRREVMDSIFKKRRRVDIAEANLKEAQKTGSGALKKQRQDALRKAQVELDLYTNMILKIVEEELGRLDALSASYNKIEKREMEVKALWDGRKAEKESKESSIRKLWWQIKKTEGDLYFLQSMIRRLHKPPILEEVEEILSAGNPWVNAKDELAPAGGLFSLFEKILNELPGLIKASPSVRFVYLNQKMEALKVLKEEIDEKVGSFENILDPSDQNRNNETQPGLLQIHNLLLLAVLTEMDKLGDYLFALEGLIPGRRRESLVDLLAENVKKEKDLRQKADADRAELKKLLSELKSIEKTLHADPSEELAKYAPDPKKPIDEMLIVMDMAEEYRASLMGKDQFELLEMIVQRFWDEPKRYPLWLQYMVVHFSGMRYASSHGSWADPRELLLNLRASLLEDEFKRLVRQDDIDARCAAVKALYEMPDLQDKSPDGELPKLARSRDREYWEKISGFLEKLESPHLYERLRALKSLRQEEYKYEVEKMSSDQVLEALKDLRKSADLPDWMWNEIVRMTDLRLEEVKDESWEKVSAKEIEERNSASAARYREIINKWKEANLTDWRKEHEASGKLIVTRAVCNEVAEHIQHMRGHEGGAGLTQKPNWYQREEREFDDEYLDEDGLRPYFKKAKRVEDFKEGASILWLRYVNKSPNPWQVAHPLETIKEKDKLIPGEYLVKRGPGHWIYSEQSGIPRRRDSNRDNRFNERQYLRWMHEATVVDVVETAEGQVVLTFETNLPDEDRHSSTVGVFKRYPGDLLRAPVEDGYNPAFVGYVPEGEIPVEHLKEMLDWNKILLKRFKTAAELKAYQDKYIRSNIRRPRKKAARPAVPSAVRAKKKHQMVAIPAGTELWRTRSWGDEILVKQAGLSAQFEYKPGKKRGSNFNPLPLWTGSGVWSAIDNYLVIPRKDVENLIELQVVDEGTVKQKMNWLVFDQKYVRPYWTDGKGPWMTAPDICWGTIAFGGQLVLTDGDATFNIKMPEENVERQVPMKRLVCFRRRDWGITHDSHPWLIQRATQVDHKDQFSDTPRGIIYSPLWSPLDWDFPGNYKPQAFYLPVDWLIPYQPEVAPPSTSM
jgi:hypothetical protein